MSAEMALNLRLRQCTFQHLTLNTDTSPLQIDGGEIPFNQKFKLLGSVLAYNVKGDADIDSRIKRAQGAFQSKTILQCQVHKECAQKNCL